MSHFKLIAIRPTYGCDILFSKCLEIGKPYVFYNNYDFSRYSDNSRRLNINDSGYADIYSIKDQTGHEININISCIVGENGSGKSSLVELFYVFCYNISVITEALYDEIGKKYFTKGDAIQSVEVEVFYEINKELKMIKLSGDSFDTFQFEKGIFKKSKIDFHLNDFFYTISMNYSVHSLNSEVLGDWIHKLFHKNDGYQTPIVINPYRNKGNIDINNEEYLVKSRLITNILGRNASGRGARNNLKNLLNGKIAKRLHVKLNRQKFNSRNNENPFILTNELGHLVLPVVFKYFLGNEKFIYRDNRLNRYAEEYIILKLKSIASKYSQYKEFDSFLNDLEKTKKFILKLSKDRSHITFKLRQAINFLDNDLYARRKESFDLTVDYISRKLDEEKSRTGRELIDILPPAFFDIDIEFEDRDRFDHLSSGEKQRAYIIATLIYHLNNLNSTEEKYITNKYKNVNIIFDEIELYFHPEFQRNLVSDILESFKKTTITNIDSINLIFVTHSPFILSDVINNNVLFLTKDKSDLQAIRELKTFGGNIHDLLANSFFLKNGLIGEFAKKRIENILKTLTSKEAKIDNNRDLLNEIEIIGEPFLRMKLEELYYSKYDKQKRIKVLEQEIERLKKND